MYKILFSKKLSINDHFRILKSLFIFINITAFLLYAFLRLLFYSTPIPVNEEIVALVKTFVIASVISIAISVLLILVDVIDDFISKNKLSLYPVLRYSGVAVFTALVLYLAACKARALAGISKDLTTGMITSYENIEPGSTLLLMNNEVLSHTDIPLGENFVLINDDVEGLVEKDGKVSAGCKLVIKDKNGKIILTEPDLLKDEDIFFKEKAKCLKCSIATGKPMKPNENYDVTVTFWDKYGDGKIENTFPVRMINMP